MKGPQNSGRLSGIEGSSGRRLTSGKFNVAKAPSWTQGVEDFSGKVLGNWNTCHHSDCCDEIDILRYQLLLLGSTFAELDNMISTCKRKLF